MRGTSVKKIILLLALILGISGAALAKDGPFPMYQASGRWVIPNNSDLVLDIVIGGRREGGKAVVVAVYLRNKKGQVMSHGVTVHELRKSRLELDLHDTQGNPTRIVMKAVYFQSATEVSRRPFKLDMELVSPHDVKGEASNHIQFNRY